MRKTLAVSTRSKPGGSAPHSANILRDDSGLGVGLIQRTASSSNLVSLAGPGSGNSIDELTLGVGSTGVTNFSGIGSESALATMQGANSLLIRVASKQSLSLPKRMPSLSSVTDDNTSHLSPRLRQPSFVFNAPAGVDSLPNPPFNLNPSPPPLSARVSFSQMQLPGPTISFDEQVRQSLRMDLRLAVKNTWIAISFYACGARQRDRYVISALILLFVSLAMAMLALSVYSLPESKNPSLILQDHSAFQDWNVDSAMLTLDTGFPFFTSKSSTISKSSSIAENWFADRQYGIVIDAGSSGSRLLIYSWKSFDHQNHDNSNRIPLIERGSPMNDSQSWHKSINPGLSSLSSTPASLEATRRYLEPLLSFASAFIPEYLQSSTPIYLLATAGMRLVKEDQRNLILQYACETVMTFYKFDVSGGCQRQFRVISGESEGIFGWVAINYLNGGFGDPNKQKPEPKAGDPNTFGFLDMGGASTQIAFEPIDIMKKEHADDLTSVVLRNMDGVDIIFQVFVSTFLGFGVNEARRRYLESLAVKAGFNLRQLGTRQDGNTTSNLESLSSTQINKQMPAFLIDPCLSRNLTLESHQFLSHLELPIPSLVGSGSLLDCLSGLSPLLHKEIKCPDEPCLFNGVHAPIANFSKHRFIGVSEYYYTPTSVQESLLSGIGYHFTDFVKSADQVCQGSWDTLLESFSKNNGIKNLVPAVVERLQMQCFKSAWVLEVLHDGFGIPKDEVMESATFAPVNELNGFTISWTLGAMLFHVSSTILPSKYTVTHKFQFGWIRICLAAICFLVAVSLAVIFWRRYRQARASMYRRRGSRMDLPPLTSMNMWSNQNDEEGLLGQNRESIEMQ
ncbi:nucleoside phosphatase family-domain-containing protein [Chytriomyces sp. MP71]|nr:nucleoside phosphatase family-domain-containing protein [Chytriomyces sp. MP71]